MKKTVLAIAAHPDDVEFMCAGTLALLREKGWKVQIATMTPGDCGSATMSREEISRIRRQEAQSAAEILSGGYFCLECDDVFILYDRPTLLKTIDLVRQVKPAIVLTHSPSDYMIDHEMTSQLAQTACFTAGMNNIQTSGSGPFDTIPYLYYFDPMDGKDKYGVESSPNMIINISNVIGAKEKMLCCHQSQRDWLMEHHGIDEYILSMKAFSGKRGKEINSPYGEGFRQHLGHAFPQNNILKTELADLVHIR